MYIIEFPIPPGGRERGKTLRKYCLATPKYLNIIFSIRHDLYNIIKYYLNQEYIIFDALWG